MTGLVIAIPLAAWLVLYGICALWQWIFRAITNRRDTEKTCERMMKR